MAAAATEVRGAAAAVAADVAAALAVPDEGGVGPVADGLGMEGSEVNGIAERLEDLEALEEGRADLD